MKVIDKVTPEKALWAADQFIDYFKNFSSIEDYLRYAKGEAVSNETLSLMETFIQKIWILKLDL